VVAPGADNATVPLRLVPVVPVAKVAVLGLAVGVVVVPVAVVVLVLVLVLVPLVVVEAVLVLGDTDAAGAAETAEVGAEVGATKPARFGGGTVTFGTGTFEVPDAGVGLLTATAVPELVDALLNAFDPEAAVVVPLVAPEPPEAAIGTFDVT
jgi:hypothetical protein